MTAGPIADLTPTDGIAVAVPLAEGPDVTILFMEDARVLVSHLCDRRPGNAARNERFRADAGLVRCAPSLTPGPGGHRVVDSTKATLTIDPSILCEDCGMHGWVRDGRWVTA